VWIGKGRKRRIEMVLDGKGFEIDKFDCNTILPTSLRNYAFSCFLYGVAGL
jgi:hypothetical protein